MIIYEPKRETFKETESKGSCALASYYYKNGFPEVNKKTIQESKSGSINSKTSR